jgi:hypothetical protein
LMEIFWWYFLVTVIFQCNWTILPMVSLLFYYWCWMHWMVCDSPYKIDVSSSAVFHE